MSSLERTEINTLAGQSAPSIGTVDLSYDPLGNRVRQILDFPIEGAEDLVPILVRVNEFALDYGATRRMVRALVKREQLSGDRKVVSEVGFRRESTIPLAGDFDGYVFAYYGNNNFERRSTAVVEDLEAELLEGVLKRPIKSITNVLEDVSGDYVLERIKSPISQEDQQRLVEMYAASFSSYPFDIESSVVEMIENPQNHVYVARNREDGLLDAVAATEEVVLGIRWSSGLMARFMMREMGDSAKSSRSSGLNAPLKIMLIHEAARADGCDLLFCETRAALGAVNAVNRSIGMGHKGTLPKHTIIGSSYQDVDEPRLDGEVNGRFGNMNVWALNRRGIEAIAMSTATFLEAGVGIL